MIRTADGGLVSVTASRKGPAPEWAVLQRRLIDAVNEAAPLHLEKYTEPGGVPYYADDVDDLYEMFYNWGLFYALGGREELLTLALQEYNAVTRFCDDGIVSRRHPRFGQQLHNEYYNDTEWHHQSEGNMLFYDFGVASPAISENVRRARGFAAMFTGEDPRAPNYDRRHRILRSPVTTSRGPRLQADRHLAKTLLTGRDWEKERFYGVRASLHPHVGELDLDWDRDPQRRAEIVRLAGEVVLDGDVPQNMAATALVTNAYLYTGDEKYRQWVLDYVEAWIERMRKNRGIMPDNVGPTGEIGENRGGQWWGGYYGWNSRFSPRIMLNGTIVGAECALLLSGDYGYLDVLRSQLRLLFDNAVSDGDGQLLLPHRYGPDGWYHFQRFRIVDAAHLWHASMERRDYELIERLRAGDREGDWNRLDSFGEKNNREGDSEYSRFQYYDGRNPDWPVQVMRGELRYVQETAEAIRADSRGVAAIVEENRNPPNPVVTKGLTQMTTGSPHSIYNGGLLRSTVRHFDADARRPGLPEDVAAFVDLLEAGRVGLQLVNTGAANRNLVLQAGAFGEHRFTDLAGGDAEAGRPLAVNSRHLAVRLPPETGIRLEIGLRRFANRPGYAFPWHGGRIPVPFQP